MRKKFLLTMLTLLFVAMGSSGKLFADETQNVAKVGDTEYATIDEAIAAWTNGTTLTLLADVTLTNVIKLNSDEYHILDLGTYTMTAAKNKDAIQYEVKGRSTASYALDIKADAYNPGGITATNGSIVSHTKPFMNAPDKDRPITRFYGGVFNASNIVKQGGSWGAGYTGSKAPYFYFYGGVFNGTISTNRSQVQFHGGTFNGQLWMSVDSSSYGLILGGKFKELKNNQSSDLDEKIDQGKDNYKFTIGSAKMTYDRGIYVDKDGYYVITSAPITEVSEQYPAVYKTTYDGDNYFYYSAAQEYGMFYEDVDMAIAKHGAANVTIWEKPAVTIPEDVTGDATVVEEIKNNTALKDYTPENLPAGAELEIELVSVGETFVYDVTPMANGSEVEPTEAITFRLPVPKSVDKAYARVYHDDTLMDIYTIQGEDNAKYVEIESADFSEFAIEPITHYEVATYQALIDALANDGAFVIMTADITATATQSSGYGKAGIVVDAGDILDGNGKTLTINGADATWDCAIAMRGGEVKNLTIAGAMRGVFMPGANGDVVIDNCVFKNVVYTFNSDAGSKEYTVTIKNTTLNGWTSFSAVHKAVTFESCTFGEGSGYAFCRPYQATTFVDCAFAEGYEFDTSKADENSLAFNDCTYNGEALSAENNAMFYNGGSVLINGNTTDVNHYVATIGDDKKYTSLQAAVNAVQNNQTITLIADITENVTLTEKTGLYYTIDGGGKKLNGTITVNSLSDTNDNRRITVKNIEFVDSADANVDFISSVNTNHYPRLTIEGCTFTGSGNDGDVAVRLKSAHSVIIKDCTGTGLHSFLQNTSGWNLTVENVTVTESKSGLALGTVQGVTVKDCNITADGYGIRMDAQYNNNAVIESNTINAFIPVVVRKAEVDSNIEFKGTNTMTATNADGIWCAIGTSEYEANGTMPTAATGKVRVTLNDANLSMEGVFGAYVPVAEIGDVEYTTLEEAFKAATEDCTIEILSDVTVDYAWDARNTGAKFTVTVTINGNGKTIKFTNTVNDNNWNTVFRFEENATVNNLTVDISEANGAQRVITAKKSLNVDGLKIVGNAKYGIIFGEGAIATDLAATEIVVKNSTLNGTRRAISDNEGGKDVKSVEITGNTLNANAYISASESIVFNNNTVDGEVDLRSYAADNVLSVEAKENSLKEGVKNYIYAKTIDAQEEFETKNPPLKVSTKAELNAALTAAKEGNIIQMTADIDYGTDQLAITKAVTLDLGGYTLKTQNAYGGMSVKNNPTIKNGTIVHASNTAAIKVWNATAFEDLVIDVQGKGDANKTIGGIVLQSGSTTRVGSIKNVTIKGAALTNGIETYNCGDATENVIGAMENVTINANGTAMLISAPCGTATNCSIKGGVTGIEIWIKGNYSASLELVGCDVEGGVYAHDEISSNPDIVNNGTLSFTADEATTGADAEDVTLTIARAEAENVKGVLKDVMDNAKAKVNDTYYLTLTDAIAAVKEGETITIFAGTISEGTIKLPATLKNVTIKGAEGAILKGMTITASDGNTVNYEGLTFDGITFDNSIIVFTGMRNGLVKYSNIAITNCKFKNIVRTGNYAAFHFNSDTDEAMNGFTFTNNIIDGVTGSSNSGINLKYCTGEIKVQNNIINNVAFRPYLIQMVTNDGVADNFVSNGNTFSGSAEGRLQVLANVTDGTDKVTLVVNNNIFKDITEVQQFCYYNFNPKETTADFSHNYYDIDIAKNPGKIYYNNAAASTYDLFNMGVFPIYKELNEDGRINTASEFTPAYGSNSPAYIGKDDKGNVRVWGEGGGNAKESFVLKLYAGETLVATTTLNNVDGIIDGNVYVTWNFYYPSSNDEYWTTTWEEGHPNSVAQPTKLELVIDGAVVATTNAVMHGPDNLNPVVWRDLGGVKTADLEGEGTAENPYLIKNINELKFFRDDVNAGNSYAGKFVKLTADINLNDENWTPIGFNPNTVAGNENYFAGTFDGGEKTIKNLKINTTENGGVGLFGTVYNATFKNIILENVDIKAIDGITDTDNSGANGAANYIVGGHFGAVAGYDAKAGTVAFENVHVKGLVKIEGETRHAQGQRIGGIFGGRGSSNVSFKNVSVKGNEGSYIKGFCSTAGVVGQYQGVGTFENVETDIDVYAVTFGAGGIAGIPNKGTSFTKCSAAGDITLDASSLESNAKYSANYVYRIGGIAGCWSDSKTGVLTLIECTFTGNMIAKDKQGNKPTAFDYDALVGRGYTLSNCAGSKVVIDGVEHVQVYNDVYGFYKVGEVYEIGTLATLKAFRDKVNAGENYQGKTVVLTADIDLNNEEWTAIGTNSNPFKGTFDGQDHTISNLKCILDHSVQRAALFGQANNATIKNVTVNNVECYALARVSAIVGGATSTTIENCHVTGTINLKACQYVGAIVGYGYATIKDCSVTGTEEKIATFTSHLEGCTTPVENSHNQMYIGGIAGWMGEGNSSITDCHVSYAKVEGWCNVGGVTGLAHYGNTVDKCSVNNVIVTGNSQKDPDRVGTIGLIVGGCAGTEGAPTTITDVVVEESTATDADDPVYNIYGNNPTTGETPYTNYVARIGGMQYITLADALDAANNNQTIEFLPLATNNVVAMNGKVVGNKTVTITGTANVDWNKGWFFVGRGGEGNGKVIFDKAQLTSKSNSSSYGFNISGKKKGSSDTNNGEVEIKNSTIELDYLINKGNITLDKSTLTVKNGFAVGGRPASETENGEDATATITLDNGSKLVVNNHNGMGLGYEAIGIMNVNSGSTFECTKDFLITANGTMNVNGGVVEVEGKFTNNGTVNYTDATVELAKLDNDNLMFLNGSMTIKVEDATGSSYAIRANDGVEFNNSYVKGTANETVRLLGSAIFNGGFECSYLQGSSAGVGGTVTIAENTTVKATYGIEFSKDYVLNGGTLELSGGNASGKLWGCVFQSGTFALNTDVVVTGNSVTYAPIYFTKAKATVNGNITQTTSGGEPIYINEGSEVTFAKTSTVTTDCSVHVLGTLYGQGNVNGKITKVNEDSNIELTGGVYTQDVNTFCAEGYVATDNNNGTWTVEIQLEGEGTEYDPYIVSSLTELELFRDDVNAGDNYAGKYVKLTANVDLSATRSANNWEPIGTTANPFKGTFDGADYTISNLVVEGEDYVGLFGYANNATIKNVTINNANVKGTSYVGAIVGMGHTGTINNCHVTGTIQIEGKYMVGGISGQGYAKIYNSSVIATANSNSYVKGVYSAANIEGDNVGGIVGHCGETNNLEGNTVKNITVSGTRKVGGIVGIADMSTDIDACVVENVTIETSASTDYANANIKTMSIGALIGQYQDKNAGGTVTNSTVKNVTFNNVNNVTVSAGPITGGKRGGSDGMLAPTGVTSSNNDIYMSTITGSNNLFLMNPVAEIDGVYYYTLQDAFNAGGEVVVVRDITLAETATIAAGKVVTLDLAGYTISQEKACTGNYNMIYNKGKLTIKGNGRLSFKDTGAGDPNFGWGSYTLRNEGTLVVENGTIEHLGEQNPGNGQQNVHMYCAIFQYSGSTTIKGGTISTPTYRSARLWNGNMTINGGNFVGQLWLQAVSNSANLAINGGTFTAAGNDGSSVFVSNSSYDVAFAVTGGTFNHKIGASDVNKQGVIGAITGGLFTEAAKNGTAAELIDARFEFEDMPVNGYYSLIQFAGEQTRELANGWSWFSTYIDSETLLQDLKAELNPNGIQIKGQDGYTQFYSGYGANGAWSPGLTSVSPTKMYMIRTNDDVEVTLEGDFVEENREITLNPGWNWIGYPVRENVFVKDAIRNIVPTHGDVIKSQLMSAVYMYGTWFIPASQYGDFYMNPGEGYMYYSNAVQSFDFAYSKETSATTRTSTEPVEYHWIANAAQYPSNMTVIAMLNIDGKSATDNYEIAAFANGECRGSARPVYVDAIDSYVLVMTISGEEVEELTFKCYDVNYGTEYELSNRFNYSSDAILGTADEPYMFFMNTLGIEESTLDMINIYPNPTTTDRAINLQATYDNVEVFNALGVKVAEYQNVDTIDALETAGVYVIRVTINGEVKNCRLVVK